MLENFLFFNSLLFMTGPKRLRGVSLWTTGRTKKYRSRDENFGEKPQKYYTRGFSYIHSGHFRTLNSKSPSPPLSYSLTLIAISYLHFHSFFLSTFPPQSRCLIKDRSICKINRLLRFCSSVLILHGF